VAALLFTLEGRDTRRTYGISEAPGDGERVAVEDADPLVFEKFFG
jgi:hypothetical protein